MVIRVWRAWALDGDPAGYRRHFEAVVRPELIEVAGFRGALVLERQVGDEVEIVVETRWASLGAVAAFAGDDLGRAVVEPGARAVLSRADERVVHYEVVTEVAASDGSAASR